ncbi:geranylgeranyl pyrophosphate synthetase [Dactylonectria estremocensis]|uniref:Geranylgeranyl pyrophosphate synthetase n=1 Tax=Dactylonectria estremocensis TaxID=1079267 RepID=A0A9P9JC10_9HYPO|nr:geranylgeranyl pyrophosphate synthetase [Dactylonectria estremocensis]
MNACSCGRSFGSLEARAQHRRDLTSQGRGDAHQPLESRPVLTGQRPSRPHRWLWRHVDSSSPAHSIDLASLEASTSEVNSLSEAHLLGTYNWQLDGAIRYPGHARIWNDVPLPVEIPRDKSSSFIDQDSALVPKYPFKSLFDATAFMQPDFRFDDVDVIINRNSLRKLLDFCGNRSSKSFRLSLLLVHNTLVVERNEKNSTMIVTGSNNTGYGHNFERVFTTPVPGLGASTGHHRILQYKLGDLNCVVRFEVDACYPGEPSKPSNNTNPSIIPVLQMQALSLEQGQEIGATAEIQEEPHMPQSMTAELKTGSQSLDSCLPQLWFGRTPWFIRGRHNGGLFHDVEITNVASQFSDWETKNQDSLRKLVTVLSQLREGTRLHGGRNCIAIFEKGAKSKLIKVFASTRPRHVLSKTDRHKFWVGKKTNPIPPEASLS